MYVQGCAYSQERPKKALICYLWLAMQEMKAMAELETARALKVYPNSHTYICSKRVGDLLVRNLRKSMPTH